MNEIWLAVILSLILGSLNGYYWSRRGYRGWHLYFIGTIAIFGLIVLILKTLKGH